MLNRLIGLETEYAIRYTLAAKTRARRPRNDRIYDAIARTIAARLAVATGHRHLETQQIFVENGGAIYYEALPYAGAFGVLEASTPECRSPSQLLLYQKAGERMLLDALPEASARLAAAHAPGTLGLLKNCRDARGKVYGAQENYEVEIADGAALWCYRVGLALVLPVVAASCLSAWALFLPLAVAMIAVGIPLVAVAGVLAARYPRIDSALQRWIDDPYGWVERKLPLLATAVSIVFALPATMLYSLLFHVLCCRRIRRDGLAFFLSRPLISGAGTLQPRSGAFGLSEKGPSISSVLRWVPLPGERPVFDIGNLYKRLFAPAWLRLRPLGDLFARRQRLQLGLSDSNAAQTAEYLKIATTSLVIDMAEAGALADLPRLSAPLRAFRQIIDDPDLQVRVACTDGRERTALQLQRLYVDRADRFVAQSATPAIEAREIVELWKDVLDALERDPSELFGRIDWVTKRHLIERSARVQPPAAQKKIDLKYHELGCGYFAQLERAGLAPVLVTEAEVEAATRRAPHDTPARLRSRLIRTLAARSASSGVDGPGRGRVSWERVVVPTGRLRSTVIRLDERRDARRPATDPTDGPP